MQKRSGRYDGLFIRKGEIKMLNIVLACQYGASTGMLCENIKKAAQKREIEAVVNAYSYSNIGEYVDAADIVLLGPQVRFQLNDLKQKYKDKHIPFTVVDTVAYGMLDGEKVLDDALQVIEEYKKNE